MKHFDLTVTPNLDPGPQELALAIELNHTIVPSRDKVVSAQFFARIFGLSHDGEVSHFAPVRVNDSLPMDFGNSSNFEAHHYAFEVTAKEFDQIFGRIQKEGVPYGSWPRALEDMSKSSRRRSGSLLSRSQWSYSRGLDRKLDNPDRAFIGYPWRG